MEENTQAQTAQPASGADSALEEQPVATPTTTLKKQNNAMAEAFNKVPNELKIVMLGGVLAFIGCFLPWWKYSTSGSFGESYTANAFQDAAFLLGTVVFLGALLSLVVAVFELLDKKPAFLKIKHSLLQLIIGGEMTLLMLIAVSIYSHSRFSNVSATIASKVTAGVSYGAWITFLGAVMILVGGWLEYKGKDVLEELGKKEEK